jgi:uncharacterized protein YuzE
MKMHYDEKSDALYLRLDDSKIMEVTQRVGWGYA